MQRRHVLAAAGAAVLSSSRVLAQDYPNKPVRIIVPLPPGGSYDYLARSISDPLGQRLGQRVLVENRAGADGRIGVGYVARQPADGYTLGIISITQVIHPALFKEIPYDILKDFEPVGIIAHTPFLLVAGPGLPGPRTAREYIDAARSKPGTITFGSSGVGSPFHLGGEQLKARMGVDMLHVGYKGTGPLITALLAGEVHSAIVPVGPYLPHIQSGKLRPLASLTERRISTMPDVPTLNEALGQSGLAMVSWLGLVAPAGTPKPVIDRVNTELRSILADAAFVRDKLSPPSYELMDSSPSAMASVMAADLKTYAKVVADAKVPAQ